MSSSGENEEVGLKDQIDNMLDNPVGGDHDFSFFQKEDDVVETVVEKSDDVSGDDTSTDVVDSNNDIDNHDGEEVVNADVEDVKESKPNQELLEELKQLRSIVTNLTNQKKDVEKAEVVEVVKDLVDEEAFKDLVDELSLDEIGSRKLGTLLKVIMLKSEQAAVEKVMKETPNVVNSTIQNKETLNRVRETFYKSHPILSEFPDLVSASANTLAKENENLTMQELLDKTAEKVYKILGVDKNKIKEVSEKRKGNETGKGKKPAFAESSGSRKAPEKKSDFAQQIDDMLSADL